MSVIGRLDEQVDAVLIAPLDRNRRPTTTERQPPDDAQPAPLAPAPHAPDKAATAHNEQAVKQDLPVWLL
jgi:hypothetical protein